MEEELKKHFEDLRFAELPDESEGMNLSTFESILSYSSFEYRMLKDDRKEVMNNAKKINGKRLTNISFGVGEEVTITFEYEDSKIRFSNDNLVKITDYEYENISLLEVKKVLSENDDYIKKTVRTLESVTETFFSSKLPTYNLEDMKHTIRSGNIMIIINALGEYRVYFNGVDVTDLDIVKKNIDLLFESIVIEPEDLNPIFRLLCADCISYPNKNYCA